MGGRAWLGLLAVVWLVASVASGQELVPPRLPEHVPPVLVPMPSPPERVTVEVRIGPDGTVVEVELLDALPEPVAARVLSAARAIVLEPATRDGEPIAARVRIALVLLPEATEPPPEEPTEPAAESEPEPEEALSATAVVERTEGTAPMRLRGAELTTVPGTFGEPLRAVESMPGVARSPFGIGFFLVRGANLFSTGFQVDGFPVPILYHLALGPAILNARFVDELQFHPGGYPVRFGRFTAGLVELETDDPDARGPLGELQLDLLRAGGMVSVPFDDGRGQVTVAARRSYYELILPAITDDLYVAYTDYQARASYRLSRDVELTVFGLGSHDELEQGAELGESLTGGIATNTTYHLHRLIGSLRARLPGGGRMRIGGMIGRDEISLGTSVTSGPEYNVGLTSSSFGLRADFELPLSDGLALGTGLDLIATNIFVNTLTPPFVGPGTYPAPILAADPVQLRANVVQTGAAAYAQLRGQHEWLTVTGGLRLELLRYGDRSVFVPEPRLNVRIALADEVRLFAATGLFSQSPSAFEVVRRLGNPNLAPALAVQTSAGIELDLPWSLFVRATGFFNRMFDLARPVEGLIEGTQQREAYRADGQGRAWGLELLVRRRLVDGLYGWVSYTLSRSERFVQDGPVVPFQYDQTHVLNLAASYEIEGWRFGGRFSLASGRPTVAVRGAGYDADADRFESSRPGFGDRTPLMHRLDLRVDRAFHVPPVRGSIYLDVQNVYNAPAAEGWVYNFDFSERRPLNGLPILGTIGVRGSIE